MTNTQIKIVAVSAVSVAAVTGIVFGIRKVAKKIGEKLSELASSAEINAEPNEQNSEVLAEASAENVCGCHCETPSDAMAPCDAVETCADFSKSSRA